MNSLPKVLIVDSGHRPEIDPLSAELAELGFASVTTSFEAADEVLALIDRPSAIFLNMPGASREGAHQGLLELADRLKRADGVSGIPVIEWDRATSRGAGGVSAVLRARVGSPALSMPDL